MGLQKPIIKIICFKESRGVPQGGYIYIYILDARERAKARSLLDPSDPSDVKAFSPPISNLEFGQPISVF